METKAQRADMTFMAGFMSEASAICGCSLHSKTPGAVQFRYCPTHRAAPELLEACETAYANLRNAYADDHLVMKRLSAALAKARGE